MLNLGHFVVFLLNIFKLAKRTGLSDKYYQLNDSLLILLIEEGLYLCNFVAYKSESQKHCVIFCQIFW